MLLAQRRSFRPPSFGGINYSSVQARNLFRWWPVDYGHKYLEFEAVARDDLTIIQSPSIPVPSLLQDGRIGQQCQAADSSLESPANLNTYLSVSEGMVSVWAGMLEAAPSVAQVFLGRSIWGEARQWLGLYAANVGGTDAIWAYNYTVGSDLVPVSYRIGALDNYVWVHTAGTLYLFKNGLLVGSTASGNNSDPANLARHMFVGAFGGEDFQVSDVRFYQPVPPNFDRIAYEIWHPATRFDLYRQGGRRLYVNVAAAGTTNAAFSSGAASTKTLAGAAIAAAAVSAADAVVATFTTASTAASVLAAASSSTLALIGASTAASVLTAQAASTVTLATQSTAAAALNSQAASTLTLTGASTATAALSAGELSTLILNGAATATATFSSDAASTAIFVGEALAAAAAALNINSQNAMTLATASRAAANVAADSASVAVLVGAAIATGAVSSASTPTLTVVGASTATAAFASTEAAMVVLEGAAVAGGNANLSVAVTSQAVFTGIAIGAPGAPSPVPTGGAGGERLIARKRRRKIEENLDLEDLEALRFIEAMAPTWVRMVRERRLAEFGVLARVYH